MAARESEELVRVHIRLFRRDVERTQLLFGQNLGRSKAMRLMIRKFLDQVEAKALTQARAVEPKETDYGDD